MLNTKIIASEVCNLTDARYFAAWGVDYMAFDCDPESAHFVSEAALAEIRTWVEGPGILGIMSGALDANELCRKLSLTGTLSKEVLTGPGLAHFREIDFEDLDQSDLTKLIIKVEKPVQLDHLISRAAAFQDCYLDIEPTIPVVKDIIATGNLGLVLKGGTEEKVGFKSYEHYDELYDLFMD